MAKKTLQLYRGTAAQNDAFTGAAGEVTMDTTTNQLRVHDGSTAGGHKVAKDSDVVHLDGTETITGLKTFKQSTGRIAYIINDTIDITNPTASTQYAFFDFHDGQVSSQRMGVVGAFLAPNGHYGTYMQAGNITGLRIETDGVNAFTSAPTPTDARENSTQVATTAWAKNNFFTYTANCITEIPQDIKLELSSGTLTLKAGSKVYVPNGAGVFDEVSITTDRTITNTSNDTYLVLANNTGTAIELARLNTQTGSGTTTPTTGYWVYYNTSDNKVYRILNGVVDRYISLPIAIITVSGGAISSIDQIFHGIGYIGSHVFVTKGMTVAVPDGRNPDGSLNNIISTVTAVTPYTRNLTQTNVPLWFNNDGTLAFSTGVSYDPVTNKVSLGTAAQIATCDLTGGVISNFRAKYAFYAADYNDFQNLKDNLSALDAQNVKLSGNQTVAGTKTFSSSPVIPTPTTTDKSTKAATTAFVKAYSMGVPNYSSATAITSGWTATGNGWVFGGRYDGSNMGATITINGNTVFQVSSAHAGNAYGIVPVATGDVVTLGAGTYYFLPCKNA